MHVFEAIKNRRTHKLFDARPVPGPLLQQLLQLAMCAPNHRRNEPWRFTVVTAEQIPHLWQALSPLFPQVFAAKANSAEGWEKKRDQLAEKLLKVGAIIYVTSLKDSVEAIERENYAASCTAVQNLLLAATASSLGSFWSTSGLFAHSQCLQILGRSPEIEMFVGAIWLGYPTHQPAPPQYDQEKNIFYWK